MEESEGPPKAEIVQEDEIFGPAPTPRQVAVLSEAKNALDEMSPGDVANAWIEPSSGKLVVGVTPEADRDAVEAQLAEQGVEGVTLLEVEHSQEELDAIVEDVYGFPGMEQVSSAMHDYSTNTIVLTSHVPVTDELREAVFATFGDAAVISSEPVIIELSSREADTSPFWAGAWIGRRNSDDPHCTLGFSWKGVSGGDYMLTAGHCYPRSSDDSVATDYGTGDYTYRVGQVAVSTVDSGGTVGSNGDLALIDTGAREGGPKMWTGGPTSTTITSINSVDKWTSNGTAVCYSGMKRGVQCGQEVDDEGDGGYNVEDEDYSFETPDGDVYTHVALATKGWGRCVIPGDSGAPVYINTAGVGVAAHGILSGRSGGGDDYYVGKYEPSNCKMMFTEIGQAYHAYNGHVEID